MSLPIIQNTRVGDFQCRIYQSDFVIEYSTLRVLFVYRGKEKKRTEPIAVCALLDFFFTLICRNAKEIQQDPRAGKLW